MVATVSGGHMKSNNICKFPLTDASHEFSVFCFVLESDMETMQKQARLANNRMILVIQGEGDFLFDGIPFPFSAGTLIFGFEGEAFSLKQGTDVRYLYIDFNGARGNALCQRFGIHSRARANDNFNSLIPFCQDCLLSTSPQNIDIAGESALLYVFSRLADDLSSQNGIIQSILEITEEHFRDPSLSMAFIASKIGYNPKYLSHYFKKKMNVNYSEYLRSFRFKYAISLFELGINSVKNVALLSGFSDPLYFSNAFKKAIGISPKEFISQKSGETDS